MSRNSYVRYRCEFCGGYKDVDIPGNQEWADLPYGWVEVERKPGLPQRADYCGVECAARSFYNPGQP